VSNTQNASAVDLASVALQYWFAGPLGGRLPPAVDAAPWDYFEGRCEWASPPVGCARVALGIAQGLPDVPGAAFALNVSFAAAAGALAPTGEGAVPFLNLGKGLAQVDVLLTVNTRAGVAQLNSSLDYSFLDTPRPEGALDPGAGATIVPRRALPNPRMPAYLGGRLAWGAPPSPSGVDAAASNGATPGGPAGLPGGVSCESVRGGTTQSCSSVAVYCCASPDPAQPAVAPDIPQQWPPPPLPGAAAEPPAGEARAADGAAPSAEAVVFPALPLPPPRSAPNGEPQGGGQSGGGGGSVAWVAGVAIGVAVGLAAAAGGALMWWRRRRRRRRRRRGALAAAAGKQPLSDAAGAAGLKVRVACGIF
jgi:hypothetical protein